MSFSIYIVDDEKSIRRGISFALRKEYSVKSFATGEEVVVDLQKHHTHLILLDICLPGLNGIEVLKKIRVLSPRTLVIMITAYEDIKTVVDAIKLGAYDYVLKPVHMDTLKVSIRNALKTINLHQEIQCLQERYLRENMPALIWKSNIFQDVIKVVDKIAQSQDAPVLIVGESGTGKELIARAIHYKGPNFKEPFITLNCASIPKELVESELFGYEKGAFSGATSRKPGLVEEAAGGTLFLDEIGDLHLEAQAKLLRFTEDGEYFKVGGTKKLRVATRIISATNKDLNHMVTQGLFRRDFYYRLVSIKLEIPSLNQRKEDIVPIANHFLEEFNQKYGKNFAGLAPESKCLLENHDWKGNIRELRNLIERGVLLGNGEQLLAADLGISHDTTTATQGFLPLPDRGIDFEALEAHYISEALNKSQGNDTTAARLLNMGYYAFRYRKKKLREKLSLRNVT